MKYKLIKKGPKNSFISIKISDNSFKTIWMNNDELKAHQEIKEKTINDNDLSKQANETKSGDSEPSKAPGKTRTKRQRNIKPIRSESSDSEALD